jgi:phosphate transport system protein
MPTQHTAKSFEEELQRLQRLIARMGGLAEAQLASAIQAVAERNSEMATATIRGDAKVDDLEQEVDDLAVQILARRQPVAVDLRMILSALKISAELERIADYAANVAKRAVALNQVAPVRPVHAIPRMGQIVKVMIKDVLDAYVSGDVEKAVRVWNRDEELDELYSSLFRELLTYMMEDPRNITASTHLLFIAKNIERIGDHATNIAETVHFLVRGVALREARPKHDETSFEVVKPTDSTKG